MNTDLLRSFVEVARNQSYTKAARTLYVSQPAVYQHVHTLEQILGATLVRQAGKRVVLTIEGKIVLEQAVKILTEVGELLNSVLLDEHASRSSQLEIAVGTTFGQTVLPRALRGFRDRYPRIAIRAAVLHNTDEIDELVLRLGYDGAFHSDERPRNGLEKDPLLTDTLMGIVPTSHPLATKSSLSPIDIVPYGLIWYSKPYVLRRRIETWAAEQGVALPTAIELDSQTAMVTAVAAGAGVTIASELSALPFINSREVKPIPLAPPLRRQWFFVHRAAVPVPRALSRLVETLAATTTGTEPDQPSASMRPLVATSDLIDDQGGQ